MTTFKIILSWKCTFWHVCYIFSSFLLEEFKCFCLASPTINFLLFSFHQPPSKFFLEYFKANSRHHIISSRIYQYWSLMKRISLNIITLLLLHPPKLIKSFWYCVYSNPCLNFSVISEMSFYTWLVEPGSKQGPHITCNISLQALSILRGIVAVK